MLKIGQVNTLNIVKQHGGGFYLASATSANVLLVDKHLSTNPQIGDSLEVFVYVDSEGHLAATTIIPLAQVDDIAYLKVVALNYTGAFLDWGLPKNLLLPFGEQHHEVEVGRSYLVKVLLDDKNRLVATTKIDKYLEEEATEFNAGDKVSLMIADKTELGIKAIVNNQYWGLLYNNEVFQPLHKGQAIDGYIKALREDNKLDLSLYPIGYKQKVLSLTDTILEKLKLNNGVLNLSDKSPPELIYHHFGVSKKAFKQAIGALYKQKLIVIDEDGIRLV
ncbi:MAG: S1-like domain-containing RNA-binding protein [Methylococcaceae bacterium]